MSRSTDPGHFFQTDASESTWARKKAKSGNKNGNPIVLQSKILNAIPDPFSSSSIYIAESAGCVRKVNIEVGIDKNISDCRIVLTVRQTRDTKTAYKGPVAPVTSIAVGGQGGSSIFAGCWDKDIWSWDRDSKAPGKRYKGHSDFVKAILCANIGGKNVRYLFPARRFLS
jgi:WD40 repeat protein